MGPIVPAADRRPRTHARRTARHVPQRDDMKLGLELGPVVRSVPPDRVGPELARAARRAEAAGFDSVWVWDHLVDPFSWDGPILEAWTAMGFIAASTSRVTIGTLVNGVTYRYPAVLVKQASTLDVLSGGRAYLGIGAAWHAREHRAFGVPFPSLRTRFELLEETLEIAHRAWRGERGPFRGRHLRLAEQIDVPAPLSRPRPRILVGGGGERRTLRLVARYADAGNFGSDPASFRRKRGVLRRHCEEVDRPIEEIELTSGLDVGDPADGRTMAPPELLLERIGRMRDAGADHLIFPLPRVVETDAIERFGAEVIAALRRADA
jgi:F420-dependent oxidoreductase-like protein